jgi:hypothetical protein
MGSLDLQELVVVRSEICTDTPLVPARPPPPAFLRCHTVTPFVPARLPPPACLRHCTVTPFVPAWNPPCACLRRRTVTPSLPTCLSLQRKVVACVNTVPAILHDGRGRNFSPVVQYGRYSVYPTISFAPTVPSVLLHDA